MQNKKTKASSTSPILDKLKGFFRKDLAFKIISLIFAMLIWGYVMMDQDPVRPKTLGNISASFEGESDLISRKLIIRGNRNEMLSNLSAKVNVQLTRFAEVDEEDVKATVSLRNVAGAGIYSLPVFATCTNGTVESVTPGTVEVEIDHLVVKRIPIEYKVVAELPEGYWAPDPILSRTEIDIQGPEQDISGITKGICYIDLSARTESYNEAMPITLVDAKGNAQPSTVLYGQLASVSVKQTVVHKRTLRVNAAASLMGADNLPGNYEIAAINVTPTHVDVAGKANVLDTLSDIQVQSIDVAGRSESLLTSAPLIVPEGVTLTKEDDLVSVYIDIREKVEENDFAEMPVKVIGAAKRAEIELDLQTADLHLSGGVSLMKKLDRANLGLYVDVTDLAPGEYDLRIQLRLPDEKMLSQLSYTLSSDTVHVTIR